ncbi:MAG: dienelactone hydrolase family protein [Amaricoccus sp.]
MCEHDEFHAEDRIRLSRRAFGALTGAAGVAMLWRSAAQAAEDVTGADVSITTPDGTVDAYFVHPAAGKAPGVIMWPDIFGLRPAFREMADRLAGAGYAVLVVNPFYRDAKGVVVKDGEEMSAAIQRLMPYARNLTPTAVVTDATAFAGWLDQQPAVDTGRKIGVVGFCMSGSYTIRAAAALPSRVGAGASFHGAGIATDAPDSPHLLAPETKARFLFAIAQNDDANDPASKDRLKQAFGDMAVVEVYPADHGWMPPDSARHDEAQAERGWAALLALLQGTLA